MEKIDFFRFCVLYFYSRSAIFRFIFVAFGYSKFNAKLYAFICRGWGIIKVNILYLVLIQISH